MLRTKGEEWEHTTAKNLHEHGEPVGVDLFDETAAENTPMTAIYIRFADGTRWPARTVNMTDRERAQSVLEAWASRGEVKDYRKKEPV